MVAQELPPPDVLQAIAIIRASIDTHLPYLEPGAFDWDPADWTPEELVGDVDFHRETIGGTFKGGHLQGGPSHLAHGEPRVRGHPPQPKPGSQQQTKTSQRERSEQDRTPTPTGHTAGARRHPRTTGSQPPGTANRTTETKGRDGGDG